MMIHPLGRWRAAVAKREQARANRWRLARAAEAQAAWRDFCEAYPFLAKSDEEDPDPVLPEGFATGQMFTRYLEKRTGLSGWKAEVVGTKLQVTPPERRQLVKLGITIREIR